MSETPNTKPQTPEKLQTPNSKIPQASSAFLVLGIWSFLGVWILVFGV
jgi:hypothetical protein